MKQFPNNGIIIDLGCAIGSLTNAVNIQNGNCIGIEPDISKLRKGKNYRMIGDFIQAVGEFIPIRDNKINTVICHSVLTYVRDIKQVISEVKRVLKVSGLFLALEFNSKNFLARRADRKANVYSKAEYRKLFLIEDRIKIEGNFDYLPYWIKINGFTQLFRLLEMILEKLPYFRNLGGFVRIKYEK